MKLYTSYTRLELMATDKLYLIEERLLNIKTVSEIPEDSKEIDLFSFEDEVLLFKNQEVGFNYKYKTFVMVNTGNPNILGIIDIENSEDIVCDELQIKLSVNINYVTSTLSVNLIGMYKLPETGEYLIKKDTDTSKVLNLFESLRGDAYNLVYTTSGEDYFELPFSILTLDSDIKVLLKIPDEVDRYIYIETSNGKYLFDFELNKLYQTISHYISGFEIILVDDIIGLNYNLGGVWYNTYGTEVNLPNSNKVYCSTNKFDAIFYEEEFTHISKISYRQIVSDEYKYNITSDLYKEFFCKSTLLRTYKDSKLLIKTSTLTSQLSSVNLNYLICTDTHVHLKYLDGKSFSIDLNATSSSNLIGKVELTLPFGGRKYRVVNNCIYLYE